MLKTVLYVFLGGGMGCVLRFLIGKLSLKYYAGSFPVGTLIANVLSCIIVAAIVYGFAIKSNMNQKAIYFLLITGFCGGLSTFSTFSFETFELLKQGHFYYAILNVLMSIGIGIAAMFFFYNKTLS